jgi:hypothetical protein
MKKIFLMLTVTALTISFVACNGTKKAEDPANVPATETVQQEEQSEATLVEPTPSEALKAFQAFAKEYGEAFNNIMKDPQKYTQLASLVQGKVADMERIKTQLTVKELKDYEKALKIITDVSKVK